MVLSLIFIIGLLIGGWIALGVYAGEVSLGINPTQPDLSAEEWPVVAESPYEQNIHTLASVLRAHDIECMVVTESPTAVQGAIGALRNRLRVKPEYQSDALDLLRDEGHDNWLVEADLEERT